MHKRRSAPADSAVKKKTKWDGAGPKQVYEGGGGPHTGMGASSNTHIHGLGSVGVSSGSVWMVSVNVRKCP